MLSIDNIEFADLLFYSFGIILLVSALRVVTVANPVHAALFLILSFFSASALWILLGAEFLAITLVLVYVGAVMVLFLFVIMMARLDISEMRKGFWANLGVAVPVGLLIIFEMTAVIIHSFGSINREVQYPNVSDNTYQLGMLIYTEYFFPLQISAVLLLLAMVSAIALTLRRRKDVKGQDADKQIKAKPASRVRMYDSAELKKNL